MHVYGQLISAQLENSVGNPAAGGTPTGRMYIDTTSPSNSVPKYFNGTSWLPLLTQTLPFVTTASTTSTVINWANGLYQQIVLAAHTTISFSNPIPGNTHVLIITQRATEPSAVTPYMYCFNFPDQYTRRSPYITKGVLQSSESAVYAWYYEAGIKAGYANIPVIANNPPTLPSTLMTGIAIHPTKNIIYGGRTSSPYLSELPFSDAGNGFRFGAAGAFLGTIATFAAQVISVDSSPDGDFLAAASGSSPYLQCFNVDSQGSASTVNSAWSNPGTLPAGAGQCVAIHPSGSNVVIGHTTTPFMSCYPITSGAFGTKLSNPSTLPAAQVNAVAWTPTGDYLAVASGTSPYLQIYAFDPNTGFGSVSANPSTLPNGGPGSGLGRGLAWHPSGNFVALAMNTSPYVQVYGFTRSSGVIGGTPTSPGSGVAATANCVAYSPCGNYLAVGSAGGLYIYDVSAGGGSLAGSTLLTFAGSNVGVQVNDIVWSPSEELIFLALNASPYVACYPAPRKTKNYMKVIM